MDTQSLGGTFLPVAPSPRGTARTRGRQRRSCDEHRPPNLSGPAGRRRCRRGGAAASRPEASDSGGTAQSSPRRERCDQSLHRRDVRAGDRRADGVRPAGHRAAPTRARRSLSAQRPEPGRPRRPGPPPLVRRRRHGARPAAARRASRVVPQPLDPLTRRGRVVGRDAGTRRAPQLGVVGQHQRDRPCRNDARPDRRRRPTRRTDRRTRHRALLGLRRHGR